MTNPDDFPDYFDLINPEVAFRFMPFQPVALLGHACKGDIVWCQDDDHSFYIRIDHIHRPSLASEDWNETFIVLSGCTLRYNSSRESYFSRYLWGYKRDLICKRIPYYIVDHLVKRVLARIRIRIHLIEAWKRNGEWAKGSPQYRVGR